MGFSSTSTPWASGGRCWLRSSKTRDEYPLERDNERDFFDVNGDGLPDLVDANGGNGTWLVLLNRGNGFDPGGLRPFDAGPGFIWLRRAETVYDSNFAYDRTWADSVDTDGDTMVDHIVYAQGIADPQYQIRRHASGAWKAGATVGTVDENPDLERSDLLAIMENGVGGTTKGFGQVQKGNATRVESWLFPSTEQPPACSQDGSKACVATTTEYDTYGNVTRVVDGKGRPTVTVYDENAYSLYPRLTRNVLGHETATAYDPACGALQWHTVAYDPADGVFLADRPRTTRNYDTFCRPRTMYLPGQSDPQEAIFYFLGGPDGNGAPTPSVSLVSRRFGLGNGTQDAGYVATAMFTDALGRPIEEKAETQIDGAYARVASGARLYDSRGLVTTAFVPFVDTGTAANVFSPPPAGTLFTASAYDALGRNTLSTNPAQETIRADHSIAWVTTAFDSCYDTQVEGCPGGKTVEVRDAEGRVISRESYEGTQLEAKTTTEYDVLGRVTATQQWEDAVANAATRITMTYDTLGRKISTVDPDSGPELDAQGHPGPPGVWTFGYDNAGNLLYQDDPKSGQHVQLCYDALNRMIRKTPIEGSDFVQTGLLSCAAPASGAAEFRYDSAAPGEPAVDYAVGRLTMVTDPSGATFFRAYDAQGHTLQVEKRIDVANHVTTASTEYEYHDSGTLLRITYPDQEEVIYGYDGAGRVQSVKQADGSPVYLANAQYDILGRPKLIAHGNGATDARVFGSPAQNFRLTALRTTTASGSLLDYGYTHYPTGAVKQITDAAHSGAQDVLNGGMSFRYDGLGRLREAWGPNLPCAQGAVCYDHDALGNLRTKDGPSGSDFQYDAAHPHRLRRVNGAAVQHDANGNRTGKPGQTYGFDAEDRLDEIAAAGGNVAVVYDYSGRQVARLTNGTTVGRYYSELAEVEATTLTKHYFAGGVRIASWKVAAPSGLAAAAIPALALAGSTLERPRLVIELRDDVESAAGVALLLAAPRGVRRGDGLRLRRADAIAVLVLWVSGTAPLPWELRPFAPVEAWAGGSGGTPPPALVHYHLDHLGSTQAISADTAAQTVYVRYRPYGEVRGRYKHDGSALTGAPASRYEFTGYETETVSGLEYAGARFYDPALGSFLSFDPAREFASPYSYTGGDPTNLTDPSGAAIDWLLVAVILIAASSVATAIDTGVRTGDAGKGVAAGFVTAGVGFAGLGLGLVVEPILSPAVQAAIAVAGVGGAGYGTYQAASHGYYGSAIVGAASTLLAAYGAVQAVDAASSGSRSAQGANSAAVPSGSLSVADQLAFASTEYEQRFGPSPGTVDAVALATLDQYNPISVSQNREYAGLIYEYGGSVRVTPGAPGPPCTSTGCSSYPKVWARYLPTGSRILAFWHTHGGPPPAGFSSDFFSPSDVNLANTLGGGYVGTPAGNAYFIGAGAIPNPPIHLTNQFLQTIYQTQRYLGPVPVR